MSDLFFLIFGITDDDVELANKIQRQIDESVNQRHSFEDFQRHVQRVKAEHAQRFVRPFAPKPGPATGELGRR